VSSDGYSGHRRKNGRKDESRSGLHGVSPAAARGTSADSDE